MDSRQDDFSVFEREKQEAEQNLKQADLELRAAQREAEWAKLALRLAEEALAHSEAKIDNGVSRHQVGKFNSMSPEAILKEIQDMGEHANASTLVAALKALPAPVEEIGSTLLDKLEAQCGSLSPQHLALTIGGCFELQIQRASLWNKLCGRVKSIVQSRHGKHFKPNEISTCVTALVRTGYLDDTLTELFVAQARSIALEFKPAELVSTLVAFSQVTACTQFQLGELLDTVQKLILRFSLAELTQILAAVSGLPHTQPLTTNLWTVLKPRISELKWEGVASALLALGRTKGSFQLQMPVELCIQGTRVEAEGPQGQLAELLVALVAIAAKHGSFLSEEAVKLFAQAVMKQLARHVESVHASSLVNALTSLCELKEVGIEPELLESLSLRVRDVASSLSGHQIAIVLRAFGVLEIKDRSALGPLLAQALAETTLFTITDLTELLGALAVLGETGPGFSELCERALQQERTWTVSELLALLQPMVRQPHPALVAKLLAEANSKVFERRDAITALDVVLGLGPQADSLKQKIVEQLQKELKQFIPKELAELLTVLAKHDPHKDLLQKTCESLAAQPSLDVEVVESAFRAVARLRWDHQPLLKKLTTISVPAQCSAATVASLLKSLAVFNQRPSGFIQSLAALTMSLKDTLTEQQAVDIAEALLSLEHEAPSLIEPLVQRLKPGTKAPESWPEVSASLRVEHLDWVIQLPRLTEDSEKKIPESRPLVVAVSAALTRAQIAHRVNVLIEGIQTDIALDGSSVLLRVEDEGNCLHHSRQSIGSVLFRDRLLQKMQYKVARVGYFEWGILRGVAAAEERFISGRVVAAGPVEPAPTPSPVTTIHTREVHSDEEDLYYADDDRVL